MHKKILLLSDIHGNFPALQAVINTFSDITFDAICNCGDSTVYGPFPNETLHWLKDNAVYSILGNTDRKVIKLLKGKSFKKPKKKEKRIMYDWTAGQLTLSARRYIHSLKKTQKISIGNHTIGLFHGSPRHPNEFLFPDTALERFRELASNCNANIIITGHSHTPYHIHVNHTHFINPGSVGRMFDSNPTASCAILSIDHKTIQIDHFRISWPIELTVQKLQEQALPEIYQSMYITGRKLN